MNEVFSKSFLYIYFAFFSGNKSHVLQGRYKILVLCLSEILWSFPEYIKLRFLCQSKWKVIEEQHEKIFPILSSGEHPTLWLSLSLGKFYLVQTNYWSLHITYWAQYYLLSTGCCMETNLTINLIFKKLILKLDK